MPRSSQYQAGGKPAPGRRGAGLAAGIRPLALAALVGCSPLATGAGAGDAARFSFQIPRQSAEQALIDFAEQAGVTFIFPYEEASRVEANPLRGLYTREEAIRILLENTGLSPRFGGNGVLSINSEQQSDKGKHMNNNSRGFFAQFVSAVTVALGGGLAQATAADTSSGMVIEEVIVTAQKRSERLVDVPISVSNLSADQLRDAGITHARDLSQVVPGLNFAMQGALAQPTIRGIGSTLTAAGDESNTALYIDGVYMSQMYANFFDLPSIERIEVLKGPQGTLFGRNATGGAINIITREPDQVRSGQVGAGLGNLGERQVSLYLNDGRTDTLAVNLAVDVLENDGYIRNSVNGDRTGDRQSTSVYSKWQFTSSASTTLTLGLDYAERDDNANLAIAPLDGNAVFGSVVPANPYEIALSLTPTQTNKTQGISLKADVDLDWASLRSITAYRDTEIRVITDGDAVSLPLVMVDFIQATKDLSQEFNLSGSGDAYNWILGAFYFESRGGYDPIFVDVSGLGLGTSSRFSDADVTAWALFGEYTRELLPDLFITAGLRYSDEEKTLQVNQTIFNGFPLGPSPASSASWDNLSPRLVARYQLSDDANLYASVSEGFKSGTIRLEDPTPVEEETALAFEVGYKVVAGTLTLNTSAFLTRYDDIQAQVFVGNPDDPNSTFSFSLVNAAESEIRGLEVELFYAASDRLNLSFGTAILDAEYTSFPGVQGFLPRPAPVRGNDEVTVDASGNQMIRSPDWTANLGATYRIPLDSGELLVNGNLFYTDDFYWDFENRLRQDAYHLVNASVTWLSDDGAWRLATQVKNLTDERYSQWMFAAAAADTLTYALPRTYGASVEYRW